MPLSLYQIAKLAGTLSPPNTAKLVQNRDTVMLYK